MSTTWQPQSRAAFASDKFKENSSKFYTRDGRLRAHAFDLGYIEHYTSPQGSEIKLGKDSCAYIVSSRSGDDSTFGRHAYYTLSSARKAVATLKRSLA